MEKIGVFFIFVAFAGLGIIGWVLNWVCWKNKFCCCKVYHNPTIQRIFWWFSFSFLCGIIACCISGIVTSVRFGKYVKATQCGYERIYYDSQFGQLKDSYPRWEGFYNNSLKLSQSLNIISKITDLNAQDLEKISLSSDNKWKQNNADILKGIYYEPFTKSIDDLLKACRNSAGDYDVLRVQDTGEIFYNKKEEKSTSTIVGNFIYQSDKIINKIIKSFEVIEDSMERIHIYGNAYKDEINSTINEFDEISDDLKNYQTGYLDEVEYYIKVAKGCGYILVIIYLCILGLIAILGCVILLAYSYLENQKNLDIFMHIIWNCIRFFIFSFFMYGAAFGMLSKGLRDVISYNMYIFGNNLNENTTTLLLSNNKSKIFLWNCLNGENTNFKGDLDDTITDDLNGFSTNYDKMNDLLIKEDDIKLKFKESYTIVRDSLRSLELSTFPNSDDYSEIFDSTDIDTTENTTTTIIYITNQINELKNLTNSIKLIFEKIKSIINKKSLLRNIEEDPVILDSFESFDCGFLKSDLNLLYNSLYDLSVQSNILCALSCCIGFFGEVLVIFYLLSMYHYDNNIFKEGKKTISKNMYREKSKIRDKNNLENSSKNEFLNKSKPSDMKRFNQKLDLDFSSNE